MPYVCFGRKDEPGFELEESNDLIAVRTRSRRSVRGVGTVEPLSAAPVADCELVLRYAEAGVEVYRVPEAGPQTVVPAAIPRGTSDDDPPPRENRSLSPMESSADSMAARKQALRQVSDVHFAGSVLVLPGSEEPVLYTENLYVRFVSGLDLEACEALVRDAGLVVKEQLGFAPNAFFLAAPEDSGQRVFEMALKLLDDSRVIYSHPELLHRRESRHIFPEQWHLMATEVAGVPVTNAHVQAEAAHSTSTGRGITIAVIDDGVDIDHVEFQSPGKIVAPLDASSGSSNPRPRDHFQDENHGTACAGVACADGLHGASGVAPDARLMPIRLSAGLGSVSESKAFQWAADNGADVISCSWGPPDGRWFNPNDPQHGQVYPLPASARDAIEYAIANGRGGKGCVICWAAGNGNESVDNDGYASYPKVIAVAACNDRSKRSVYSDFGAAVWCSFPSNDFGFVPTGHPEPLTPGIWTTDRSGARGYNPGQVRLGSLDGDFANSFGGTSSACPGVAGVAALVLSVNPGLRWHEVKDLLRRSCDRIDPTEGDYDDDGHSDFYGFGRINADTAVRLASVEIHPMVSISRVVNQPIPDLGRVETELMVTEAAPPAQVAFHVLLLHTYVGDLVITAIPPAASELPEVILLNREGAGRDDLDRLFDVANTPELAAYSGQDCSGTWTVRVEDQASRDSGTLLRVRLDLMMELP